MSIKCRFCGALISGDFTKGDTFPARNIDNKTGKEVKETFPICRECYYETEGAEQEKKKYKEILQNTGIAAGTVVSLLRRNIIKGNNDR